MKLAVAHIQEHGLHATAHLEFLIDVMQMGFYRIKG